MRSFATKGRQESSPSVIPTGVKWHSDLSKQSMWYNSIIMMMMMSVCFFSIKITSKTLWLETICNSYRFWVHRPTKWLSLDTSAAQVHASVVVCGVGVPLCWRSRNFLTHLGVRSLELDLGWDGWSFSMWLLTERPGSGRLLYRTIPRFQERKQKGASFLEA